MTATSALIARKPAKASPERDRLREALEAMLRDFDYEGRARHDPISFPMRYTRGADIEAAGFLASAFAYGRVGQFMGVLERLLAVMGRSPAEFMAGFVPKRDGRLISGISYRFNSADDIAALIYICGVLLRRHGSLKKAFMNHYGKGDSDIGPALGGLVAEALAVDTRAVYGSDLKPPGLRQFFPSPQEGSACKRACLYLRWMVRDREPDFGLWKEISPSGLVIPLDTHIARVSRCLGLSQRKSAGWKMALEITASLRALDAEDPLKYDFALCHRGIAGICGGKWCNSCELKGFRIYGRS